MDSNDVHGPRPFQRAIASQSGPSRSLTVLIVDADGDSRELYRQSLEAHGVSVHEAVDGRDGLVQVYSVRPDIVMLDARLPFIDGLQLCALLRTDSITASLGVIAITSDGTPEHVKRFRERGANVVFVKPVPLDMLAVAVRETSAASNVGMRHGNGADRPALTPVAGKTLAKARAHERYVSTNPPQRPPQVRCPHCDTLLQYERSHVGGVSDRHPEQWDYFTCVMHGTFQYRHRTKKLRPAS